MSYQAGNGNWLPCLPPPLTVTVIDKPILSVCLAIVTSRPPQALESDSSNVNMAEEMHPTGRLHPDNSYYVQQISLRELQAFLLAEMKDRLWCD